MTDVAIPRDAAAIERPMIIDSPLGRFVADLHAAEEPAWVMGRLTSGSGIVRYR